MLTNDRGRQVRRARLLRHMKQSHLAELMGVDQATVSRWERGTLALSDGRWSAVLQLLTGPSDSSYDAALKRLVQSSAHKVHRHCCKVSDEAAFCLIQRPYISKTLLTRRISPRGSP